MIPEAADVVLIKLEGGMINQVPRNEVVAAFGAALVFDFDLAPGTRLKIIPPYLVIFMHRYWREKLVLVCSSDD
jgi:hypothetical protein